METNTKGSTVGGDLKTSTVEAKHSYRVTGLHHSHRTDFSARAKGRLDRMGWDRFIDVRLYTALSMNHQPLVPMATTSQFLLRNSYTDARIEFLVPHLSGEYQKGQKYI
jgi:hypothetical protein